MTGRYVSNLCVNLSRSHCASRVRDMTICRTLGITREPLKRQTTCSVYCITYFIHFLPLVKRNAVYQSYYIHTNGHTHQALVMNKSLKLFFFLFVCLFWDSSTVETSAGGQDTTAFLETKPN